MYITQLQLKNFRNYKEAFFNFGVNLNFITGFNTKGKTNLLEAIYFFVIFQSFRNRETTTLIGEGSKITGLELSFRRVKDGETKKLGAILDATSSKVLRKIFKLNGVVKQPHQLMGEFQAVLFTPEDLNLILDQPSSRRRFTDSLIARINPVYYRNLLDYKRVIQARNRLLFLIQVGKADLKELDFWNKQFLQLGEFLIQERLFVLGKASPILKEKYQLIAETKDVFTVDYQPSLEIKANLKQSLKDTLNQLGSEEIKAAQTLFGPHRDDLIFKLNGKKLALFGSRGEQRSAILALKLAELALVEKKINEHPVLLLDDVLSELDQDRQRAFLELLGGMQVLITMTELNSLASFVKKQSVHLIKL